MRAHVLIAHTCCHYFVLNASLANNFRQYSAEWVDRNTLPVRARVAVLSREKRRTLSSRVPVRGGKNPRLDANQGALTLSVFCVVYACEHMCDR